MEPRYLNNLYDNMYYDYMMPAVYRENMQMPNMFSNENEGFLRGNMESNTYIPYKNMTFIKPKITTDKESMLYDIQANCFAAHDLNLYLDTHPNDLNAIRLYNEYNNKANTLTYEYEKKYGPINLSNNNGLDKAPWAWINKTWPWVN